MLRFPPAFFNTCTTPLFFFVAIAPAMRGGSWKLTFFPSPPSLNARPALSYQHATDSTTAYVIDCNASILTPRCIRRDGE